MTSAKHSELPAPRGKASSAGRRIGIHAGTPSALAQLREIWEYRELLYFITWRDLMVRYKQTVIGVAWAVVQPLFLALTLSLFLGRMARLSDGHAYFLFAYAAMSVWQLFAQALGGASNSLLVNEQLVTLVYFPRLLIPLSAALASLADFLIAFVFLLPFLAWYRVAPTPAILLLPAFVALALVAALGIGFWLAALNVKYRDVRHTVGFLVQLWFFATPVAYSLNLVPDGWRFWYGLNPMVGVVEGFRWALLGAGCPEARCIVFSVAVSLVSFVLGLRYFLRAQDNFADYI